MSAKHLLLIADGKSKASIIRQAIEGPVTDLIPSSILQIHPNFTVILDEEAASELTSRK